MINHLDVNFNTSQFYYDDSGSVRLYWELRVNLIVCIFSWSMPYKWNSVNIYLLVDRIYQNFCTQETQKVLSSSASTCCRASPRCPILVLLRHRSSMSLFPISALPVPGNSISTSEFSLSRMWSRATPFPSKRFIIMGRKPTHSIPFKISF